MDYEVVKYEVAEGVATVTLNNPEKRNMLSGQMLAELVDAMKTARDADDVRAVVLTGAGDKAFCAGAGVRRRGRRLGDEAGLEEPGADAARPRRDVPPAGHGGRRRARVPALAALAHLLDRGHHRGRHRILRETRSAVEGTVVAGTEQERKHLLPGTAPLGELTEQLHEAREKAKLGGGEEKIAKQHERGKLTARE